MRPEPTFFADTNRVYMTGRGGPFVLADQNIEGLLSLYDEIGDAFRFNELMDAYRMAGGIERVTSLRACAA